MEKEERPPSEKISVCRYANTYKSEKERIQNEHLMETATEELAINPKFLIAERAGKMMISLRKKSSSRPLSYDGINAE